MNAAFAISGQLRLVGAVLVLLGLAHLVMSRVLGWPEELAALRPLTRHIVQAHTFFIGVACVLLGLAPLALAAELLTPSRLSTAILVAECAFWGLRWCAQFIAFPPAVWRTSRLHAVAYVGFTLLWTWIGGVFAVALVHSLTAR